MPPSRYNIRVYGLYINDKQEVLVTDELRLGKTMTKFPGGGNHFGEGFAETVKREWMEELEVEIRVDKLFYTNDFPVTSAFDKRDQIVAVYYFITPLSPIPVKISDQAFDFEPVEGGQSFRWIALEEIGPDAFTFPIDKEVGRRLGELCAERLLSNRDLPG